VDFAAQFVECDPSILLRLEAPVLVGVGVDAGREHRDDPADDDPEDHHHNQHLHHRVATLLAEPPNHEDLASTSARACRATTLLRAPIPQTAHTR